MKTLRDTIDGMISDDWKERLVSEIEQCDIRLYDLERHMDKIGKESPEYSLLEAQSNAMGEYLKTITARATSFGVEYHLPSLEKRFEAMGGPSPFTSDSRDAIWVLILFYLLTERN